MWAPRAGAGAAARRRHRHRDDARRTTAGGAPPATCPTRTARRLRLPARRRRDTPLPDPRSRRQPDGRARAARDVRPRGVRVDTTRGWTGRQLAGAVIYELHVGTFTPEGTLDAAIGRLDHLRRARRRPRRAAAGQRVQRRRTTGATTACSGTRCTSRTAARRPTSASSTPATRAASASIQDVVYNHLGPSRQLPAAVRPVLHRRARNTWGDVGQPRRRRAPPRCAATSSTTCGCGCATTTSTGCGSTPCTRSSTTAAVHLLRGDGARGVAALSAHLGRPLTLIAESDLNDPRLVTPARGRRLRARRAVERRLPPRGARRADRRDDGLLRRLRAAGGAGQGAASAASSTTARARPSAAGAHGRPIDTGDDAGLAARGVHARTTTRSATGPPATGSPQTLDDGQLARRGRC